MSPLKSLLVFILVAICATNVLGSIGVVEYPAGYRSWQHVKSMMIQPGHPVADPIEGIHHIYANEKAMRGLTGGDYEDGAIFVFDLLAYDEIDNTIVERDRKRIDVMQRNSTLFANTGGWGYETFLGDSATERLDQDVTTACYACHLPAKDSNYVFSEYRR